LRTDLLRADGTGPNQPIPQPTGWRFLPSAAKEEPAAAEQQNQQNDNQKRIGIHAGILARAPLALLFLLAHRLLAHEPR
jgi:hypothetical protein